MKNDLGKNTRVLWGLAEIEGGFSQGGTFQGRQGVGILYQQKTLK
jgi:hypothetical protein